MTAAQQFSLILVTNARKQYEISMLSFDLAHAKRSNLGKYGFPELK
jgi:hypothetical protein